MKALALNLAYQLASRARNAWGWLRASSRGVRLGRRAVVSPFAHIDGVSFLGAVEVARGVRIGRGTYINSGYVSSGEIGCWCSIGYGVHIGPREHDLSRVSTSPVLLRLQGHDDTTEQPAPPRIGHDVWIGDSVIVLRGVTIGDGAVVAAGAVVTRDVAPYTVVAGVPARRLRDRFAEGAQLEQAREALRRALASEGAK